MRTWGSAGHRRTFAHTQYTRAKLSDQTKSNIILVCLTLAACFGATAFGILVWLLFAIREGLLSS